MEAETERERENGKKSENGEWPSECTNERSRAREHSCGTKSYNTRQRERESRG